MAHWDEQHNRLASDLGPEHMKSYSVTAPIKTHWRPATCAEYECDEYLYGFRLTIDTSSQLGQAQYDYITHDKTRKFSMQKIGENQYVFLYQPGQEGMGRAHGDHRVAVGRPPILVVTGGDFRGNPRGTPPRIHKRADDFIDEFANNQIRLREMIQRG